MNKAEIKKQDDMFKAEKLAIGYCKCYGHKDGTKAYKIASAAFANGYKFDKAEIKKKAICEFIKAYEQQKWKATLYGGKVNSVALFGAEYLKGL